MLDAAASNNVNATEMMIVLLRIGKLFEYKFQCEKVEWGHICIDFVKKLETAMEMSVRSHGEVGLWVRLEDLYPFFYLLQNLPWEGSFCT